MIVNRVLSVLTRHGQSSSVHFTKMKSTSIKVIRGQFSRFVEKICWVGLRQENDHAWTHRNMLANLMKGLLKQSSLFILSMTVSKLSNLTEILHCARIRSKKIRIGSKQVRLVWASFVRMVN